jgi:serine/threonine-protein kinase
VVEHVADGAGSEVYRALRDPTGDVVALKIPTAAALADPGRVRRWRREARLSGQLRHERLVRRVDLDRYRSRPYVAFEFAGGGTLRGWLSPGDGLPVARVVPWGRQVAEGLAYLHHRGYVHGDLKPDNVLVTDRLDLKLADLGAATRMRRLPLTPPRQVLELTEGTPEYLSPEQIQGRPLDARSDVYAWGVVMYELLTGACPFTGADPIAIAHAHLTESPAPLRDQRSDVAPGLEAVILTALRRDARQRQPDMAAVIADLDSSDEIDTTTRALGPEAPLELQPLGGSTALWRFVAAVAACYLLVVAGILGVVAVVR